MSRIKTTATSIAIAHSLILVLLCTNIGLFVSASEDSSLLFQPEGEWYLGTGSSPLAPSYPINGFGHGENSTWGSVGEPLGRLLPRIETDTGSNLSFWNSTTIPEPRVISNAICHEDQSILDPNNLTAFNWVWGQFITHDIDFTTTQNGRAVGSNAESLYYSIPVDDKWMNPDGLEEVALRVFRSVYLPETGTSKYNPREHPNNITSWIDGGLIYGDDESRSSWLRLGEGGLLKTTPSKTGDLLPIADYTLEPNAPKMSFAGFNSQTPYIAGDIRAQEHIALMGLHTLFVREHNRLALSLASEYPKWTDDELYNTSRALVIGMLQSITYNEYLPSLGIQLDPYVGYNSSIPPTVTNSFATLAFRIGHSQIGPTIFRLDESRNEIPQGHQPLHAGFFGLDRIEEDGGLDPIFRGLAYEIQPAADSRYVSDLRNLMFGAPGAGGQDMCAIDILRGRDHGLQPYVAYRQLDQLGLEEVESWSDITSNQTLIDSLSLIYTNVSELDAYVGMLVEDKQNGSAFGPSMSMIWKEQFQRIRNADPSFYLVDESLAPYVDALNSTRLADIILRNSNISNIQCNVFYFSEQLDCSTPLSLPYGPTREIFDGEVQDGVLDESLPTSSEIPLDDSVSSDGISSVSSIFVVSVVFIAASWTRKRRDFR